MTDDLKCIKIIWVVFCWLIVDHLFIYSFIYLVNISFFIVSFVSYLLLISSEILSRFHLANTVSWIFNRPRPHPLSRSASCVWCGVTWRAVCLRGTAPSSALSSRHLRGRAARTVSRRDANTLSHRHVFQSERWRSPCRDGERCCARVGPRDGACADDSARTPRRGVCAARRRGRRRVRSNRREDMHLEMTSWRTAAGRQDGINNDGGGILTVMKTVLRFFSHSNWWLFGGVFYSFFIKIVYYSIIIISK